MQRQFEKAIEEFTAAFMIDPDHATTHLGLSNVCGVREKLDDAIKEFKAALWIDLNHADLQNNLKDAQIRKDKLASRVRNILGKKII